MQNWEEYSKCSVKLDDIKRNLTLLFSEKKNINENIDGVLKRDFKSDFKKTQTNQTPDNIGEQTRPDVPDHDSLAVDAVQAMQSGDFKKALKGVTTAGKAAFGL